jgi:hypothetical protein
MTADPTKDAERLARIRRDDRFNDEDPSTNRTGWTFADITFLLRLLDTTTQERDEARRSAEALETELQTYLDAKAQWEEFEKLGAAWRPAATQPSAADIVNRAPRSIGGGYICDCGVTDIDHCLGGTECRAEKIVAQPNSPIYEVLYRRAAADAIDSGEGV